MQVHVAVESQFIQKYLLAIPKLKAIASANGAHAGFYTVLYGTCPHCPSAGPFTGPAIELILDLFKMEKKLLKGQSFEADAADKLARGIITCTGGHFEAVLEREDDAAALKTVIETLSPSAIPGLNVAVHCSAIDSTAPFADFDRAVRQALGKLKFAPPAAQASIPLRLPFGGVCAYTGQEIAEDEMEESRSDSEPPRKSPAGRRAKFMMSNSGAGGVAEAVDRLVYQREEGGAFKTPWSFEEFFPPKTLKRYLAVITVDGNRMGVGLKEYMKKKNRDGKGGFFEMALYPEAFFMRARILNRVAIVDAARKVLHNKYQSSKGPLPFKTLMIAGDDMLMVLRAEDVFDVLIEYAKRHRELLGDGVVAEPKYPTHSESLHRWAGEFGPLTFKAGVAIVPLKYPFAAACALAEQLADCARKEYSAVDWYVMHDATVTDLPEIKRREFHRAWTVDGHKETLTLTKRPYPILSGSGTASLDDLLQRARAVGSMAIEGRAKVARNKLKTLASAFGRGREEAEMLVQEIGKDVRAQLAPAWKPEGENENPTAWFTEWIDLIELLDVTTPAAAPVNGKRHLA
ncbi:MAG: hypothetical protein HY897_04460 [Deltaproteobacteria bacterium]|nr:hypothetical protein [Deltaproteobacteria bacterium]